MSLEDLKLKPFISRMGNKYKQLKYFIDYIPKEYNTYIEPFLGSGAVFLHIKPKKWIINDLNIDLINSWKLLQCNLIYIINYVSKIKNNYLLLNSNNARILYFKKLTEKLNIINNFNEKTLLWIILNKVSFRGSLQLTKNKYIFSGICNVYPSIPSIFKNNYITLLKNINLYIKNTIGKIYNTDYKNILKMAKKNDFIFLDPPYIHENPQNYNFSFKEKQKNKNESFIYELYNELKKLDNKGIKWMMTQEDFSIIRNIFKEYNIRKYKVYRVLSNKTKNELLITNY